MKTCKVEWCLLNKRICNWLCNMHMLRLKRHWDVNYRPIIYWEDRSNNELYSIYCNIKTRCYNVNRPEYKNYWWRWIYMSDRWLGSHWFNLFCEDMWPKPSKHHSIDRIDVNWNYCKDNCRRATLKEQALNKRNSIKYNWESVIDAEKRLWLSRWTIKNRIKRWWTMEESFTIAKWIKNKLSIILIRI